MNGRITIAGLLLVAVAAAGRPDQIVLKSGKVLTGTIVGETADRLSLQVSGTISMDVRRSQIARVVRGRGAATTTFGPPPVAPDAAPDHVKRNRKKLVCFAQISGPIDSELMVEAVRRSCAAAARERAQIAVFEIDTPGGRLDLMLEICALIEQLHPIHTVAYVSGGASGGAYSAGAVLAMACAETFMAPGTAIGAAAPVAVTARKTAVDEKHVSAVRAKMRSLAQKNGYPPKIAAAMVDAEIQIREATVNGKATFLSVAQTPTPAPAAAPTTAADAEAKPDVQLGAWVTQRGKLLTLTAVEAKRYEIATALVPSRRELVAALDLAGCRVADLDTTAFYTDALSQRRIQLQKLEGKIAAYEARAVALDPRKYKYPRHEKKHGIFNKGDFLDEGRVWRRRSAVAIKLIDGCLTACRDKLALALAHPELRINPTPVKAAMTRLVGLRERIAAEYKLRGSER